MQSFNSSKVHPRYRIEKIYSEPNRFFGEDVIVGNMCIIKIDEEGDIISLSDEDVKKYMTLFYEPIPKKLLNLMLKSTKYSDAFFIDEENRSVKWVYFNPDGNYGMGQQTKQLHFILCKWYNYPDK